MCGGGCEASWRDVSAPGCAKTQRQPVPQRGTVTEVVHWRTEAVKARPSASGAVEWQGRRLGQGAGPQISWIWGGDHGKSLVMTATSEFSDWHRHLRRLGPVAGGVTCTIWSVFVTNCSPSPIPSGHRYCDSSPSPCSHTDLEC